MRAGGETVAELALGAADMRNNRRLTPRHRLRIASHSKTFTAAGVMLLREQGQVGGGQAAYGERDKQAFANALDRIISRLSRA